MARPMSGVGKFGSKGGNTMIRFRRYIALGFCGLMLGGVMSTMGATPATAKLYRFCDTRIEHMEAALATQHAAGHISDEVFAKRQGQVDDQRDRWGC
jgi:hypothetical protein